MKTVFTLIIVALALAGCRDRYAFDHRVPRQYGDTVIISPQGAPLPVEPAAQFRYSNYRR